jgi:hypothetical protein
MISLSADPPRWRYSNQISRREANRAIYFDFEGRVNESLAFRGGTTPGRYSNSCSIRRWRLW